jgi:hypothetical protein
MAVMLRGDGNGDSWCARQGRGCGAAVGGTVGGGGCLRAYVNPSNPLDPLDPAPRGLCLRMGGELGWRGIEVLFWGGAPLRCAA